MFELFMNPWSMIAGGLLISAPVIIHLINRMRFKRVQWAAMEFLLKAQKRMRRKMIIEQLILLLLRILLVLLVGLLVGRYLGFAGTSKESQATKHVVLLDDTPSMADFWRGEDGQMTDAFKQAKKQIADQIAPAAAQANAAQTLDLLRLSDLANPHPFGRLNTTTNLEIASYLGQFEPSKVRISLVEGLKKAKERFDAETDSRTSRVLHVVSDFRSIDWNQDGEAIKTAMKDLVAGQVQVHLIDTAHPFRRDDKKTPLFHENVGIIELKPKGRVVAKDQPVEFTVKIKNFGNTELKDVRCAILVNGDENRGLSLYVPTLPANQDKELPFTLQFSQTGTDQKPLERFNLVTARLELTEQGGLLIDNTRHAIVEVRERLSVLVVEGTDASLRDKKEADGFYLKRVFLGSIGGMNWINGTVRDLETKDLREYSSVYLLNVPELSEPAVKNLEGYVREGGGLGVFLGAKVKPEAYNKLLYKDGQGLFPVPLPPKFEEPKGEQDVLKSFTQKILRRDPSSKEHPAVRGLYRDAIGNPIDPKDVEKFYNFVNVKKYWAVKRLGKWRDDAAVKEIYCLPSEMPMGEAQTIVEPLLRKLREQIQQPKYQPYRAYLDQSRPVTEPGQKAEKPTLDQIRDTMITSDPVALLADQLDRLLADQGSTGDPSVPILREFWSLPELADLRAEFARIRDTVKFGDPLYLAKQFGTGRVTAILTTAGEEWNDWPSGWGKASFAPVMGELQKYLAGGGSDDNLSTGADLRLTFDPNQYKPTIGRTWMTFESPKDKPAAGPPTVTVKDLGEQQLIAEKDRLVLSYTEAVEPGAYVFTLTRLKDANAAPNDAAERQEYLAYAFNVDAVREGDLRRANRDDLAQLAEKAPMHSPDDDKWTDELKQKPSDLSSGRWLYLVILLVLVVEQAMAVRLSHHSHPGELEAHAPTAAAVLHRGAAPSPAEAEAESVA